ncbi:lipopolysaccharide biosynthesis protein [Paenibacillus thermotolerans]|uniref:lipopolysaccharide biosynthesis protein n=1 Tax=Paenibacillus thermotolerans TaxID=3027807 RepID=UPI002367C6A0|nr:MULTISPECIES: oligosaccharide flippase family protein [unclassified Paenibacillus]
MKILRKKSIGNAGIYLVTNILNAFIPFLVLPIMTRFLSPSEYGILSMFEVLVALTSPIVGLSIHGAISKQYFERESLDFPVYVSNCIFILLISTFFVSIFYFIFADPISNFIDVPIDALWLAVVFCLGQFLTLVTLTLWQVEGHPIKYGLFRIGIMVLNLSLSIYFVVFLNNGWHGRVQGQVIAISVFSLFSLWLLFKNRMITLKLNMDYLKHALRFGIPLVPEALGIFIITMTDRIFITNLIGIEEAGIYAVGVQISMVMMIFYTSINKAWVPWFFRNLKRNDANMNLKIVKITYFYFGFLLSLAAVLSVIAPWILKLIVGPEFQGAAKYVVWLAIGFAFSGMYTMFNNYFHYAEKTNILAKLIFMAALTNVGLSYWLVHLNGAVGAAQATAVSFFLTFLMAWFNASKVHMMPWKLKMRGYAS